jgi:tellurite resistance protein TerC
METSIWFWVAFNAFILLMLAIDLGVFNRKSHTISTREALGWVALWVSLGLAFNVVVYFWHGREAALQFLTGYILEYSLSIDNIFVFLMLFTYFKVPPQYQHRVLFWGILGALILRATLILAGITLINMFHWVIYIFGGILIVSGIKLAANPHEEIEPEKNPVLKFLKRVLPVADKYSGGKFFIRESGRRLATPLLIVLIFIELTDLMFALDSIPAIIGITRDMFIVYTSNVFAILGLRSLYFALAGVMGMFRYLPYGLAAVLIFVGVKMCIEWLIHIPVIVSLGTIVLLLGLSILLSLLIPVKEAVEAQAE